MQESLIPKASIQRLTLYLRRLERLQTSGQKTVSSSVLGKSLGLTDAQVRKDLTYFGQFGQPGIGYRIDELILSLRKILGIDRTWNVALIGFGNLGRALLHYRRFKEQGFNIVAIFDRDPDVIGVEANGLTIQSIDELIEQVREKEIKLAIICVPGESAQSVADLIVEAGISGILNFAPVSITISEDVNLSSVDLALELERLSYQLIRPRQRHAS